jgi:hypothetical protein
MPAPPPLPAQVLTYATPLGSAGPQGVWRKGALLVTTRTAVLPPVCVKCNQPADGSYQLRTYYWYHPALLLLAVVALLIFALVALITRKKADVTLGLCKQHHSKRIKLLTITWLLVLGGIAGLIAGVAIAANARGGDLTGTFVILVAIAAMIIAIFTGFGSRVIVPTKMDQQYAWFKGCGTEFLATLSAVP